MAKQVKLGKGKEFTFRSASKGSASKYPYDKWFDGTLWMLEEGEDYTPADAKSLTYKLRVAGLKRYKVVQISRLDADGKPLEKAVIIKAREMTPEERADEDVRRAEQREAFADKRASKKAKKEGGMSDRPAGSVVGE